MAGMDDANIRCSGEEEAGKQNIGLRSGACGTISLQVGSCSLNAMNLSTRLMPRPNAEGRGLFSATTAVERLSPGPRFSLIKLMAPAIRKFGLTVLTTATLCSTISVVTADPSVEVFTEGGTVTLAEIPLRWSFTTSVGYESNVSTTSGGAGSALTQANLSVSKDLRTARTQVSIVLAAGVIHYIDRMDAAPNDYTGSVIVSLRHNVSQRLTLSAAVNASYLAEPEFETDLGPARRANYFSTSDNLTASYKLSPRLSIDSTYRLGMVKYEDELLSLAQDRVDHTFDESLNYSWSPRTTLTVQYSFGLIDYDTFPRDSTTQTVLGGFDYQVSQQLKATVRGGASFRKFKVGNSQTTINPDGSASLAYALGRSTSVSWTIGYSIEEPDFSETLSRTTFRTRTGVQLSYQLTRLLSANLGFNYSHDVNSGLLASASPASDRQEFTQDGLGLVLGARYIMTNRMALALGFTHSEIKAASAIGSYSSNSYTAGLSFSY